MLAAADATGTSARLEPNLTAALAALLPTANAVITGSVYLVGEARGLLLANGWTSHAG
jgi:folylpolyglutamate synthase/dihydropteroate synthase